MSERVAKTTCPWRPRQLVAAAAVLCAGVAAMWSSWSDWYSLSTQIEEHSHVFLVVPFGAIIMYINRDRFAQIRQTGPSWAGPLLVAIGFGLAWEGFNHAHESFWHMGAVIVALGAAITVVGHGVLLKFWPAFLLLGFMVPMPNTLRLKIAFPLQTAMATAVEHFLAYFGEPVGRQGNSLTINGQSVLIVEACNGLRMVFTLILVSWLFAFVAPLKVWVRVLILVLSPLTAMVCNAIRLVPTLLMYGHASKESADKFHDIAGWGMTLIALGLLLGTVSLLEWFGVEVVKRGDTEKKDGAGGGGGTVRASPAMATAVS
jgi:exosortase